MYENIPSEQDELKNQLQTKRQVSNMLTARSFDFDKLTENKQSITYTENVFPS